MNNWRFERRTRSVGACLKGTCRDDPIPPGVYWIDVPWEDSQFTGVPKPQHWQLWLDAMVSLNWVKVISTVHHEGELVPPGGASSEGGSFDPGIDEPPRDWHLFQVLQPAPRWPPQTGLGLPTVAPQGIQTSEDDTIQSPDLKPISLWDKILPESTIGKVAVIAAGIGGLSLVIYGMTRR